MEALGASGEGYEIAKSLSHTVSNLFPSLVPIYTKEDYVKLWAGVRVDVRAGLYKEQDLFFRMRESCNARITVFPALLFSK